MTEKYQNKYRIASARLPQWDYGWNAAYFVTICTHGREHYFGAQSQNLASIIRGFKIGVTKNARKINSGFAWQSRYHDHIIRNNKSFNRIQAYIKSNPQNWKKDKFNI